MDYELLRDELTKLRISAENILNRLANPTSDHDAYDLLNRLTVRVEKLIAISEKHAAESGLRERLERFLHIVPPDNIRADIDNYKESLRLGLQGSLAEIEKPYTLFVSLVERPDTDLTSEEFDAVDSFFGLSN